MGEVTSPEEPMSRGGIGVQYIEPIRFWNVYYNVASFRRREISLSDVQLSINSGRYSEEVINVQIYATIE
jgi:hypothetical protein